MRAEGFGSKVVACCLVLQCSLDRLSPWPSLSKLFDSARKGRVEFLKIGEVLYQLVN